MNDSKPLQLAKHTSPYPWYYRLFLRVKHFFVRPRLSSGATQRYYIIYHWIEDDGDEAYGFIWDDGKQYAIAYDHYSKARRALRACVNTLKLDLYGTKYLNDEGNIDTLRLMNDLDTLEKYEAYEKYQPVYTVIHERKLK